MGGRVLCIYVEQASCTYLYLMTLMIFTSYSALVTRNGSFLTS